MTVPIVNPHTPRPPRGPSYASLQGPTILLIVALSVLGCSVRPSPRRWLLYILLLPLTFFYLFYITTEIPEADYGQGNWIAGNLFGMADYFLITDVQNELWKKGQRRGEIVGGSFWKRLQWGFDLYTSARGIGWHHELSSAHMPPWSSGPAPSPIPDTTAHSNGHTDKEKEELLQRDARRGVHVGTGGTSRVRFVLRQLWALCQSVLLFMAGDVAMQVNSSFRASGPAFKEQVWWLQPTVLGHALAARAAINSVYIIGSIITVSLGVFPVDVWPPLFGSFLDAWSVHNLWRRVWHQLMRRFMTANSTFIANLFNPSNKLVRALIKLFTAFFISSIIHTLGDIALLKYWSPAAMKFFMLQPLAIIFEKLVVAAVAASGVRIPKGVGRLVGYVWVLVWFTTVLPIWITPIVRSGMVEDGYHSPVVVGAAEWIRSVCGIEG